MNRKWIAVVLLGFVLLKPAGVVADEVGSWQTLNLKYLDTRYVDFVFFGEARSTQEPSRFVGYLLSQQVKFDLHPNLGAGINYTFLSFTASTTDELVDTHRAEFELIPRFKVGDWLEVSARNRLELRWQENSSMRERTRHRLQLDFPLHLKGSLKSAFVSGELFWDHTQHKVTEYRIVPLGFNFKLAPKVTLGVSYMLQSAESGKSWYNRHNLNTALSVSL